MAGDTVFGLMKEIWLLTLYRRGTSPAEAAEAGEDCRKGKQTDGIHHEEFEDARHE